ncbi:MAG: transposase, partial [Oscillospiraceae bacterium]
MRHYQHLSIEEREKLFLMRGRGLSLRRIAEALGRAPSTVSRELKRNRSKQHPYSPSKAQKNYQKRRTLCGRKHILGAPETRERIRRLIEEAYWSPEEISNRLKLEGAALQLSYASIYRPSTQDCLMQTREWPAEAVK